MITTMHINNYPDVLNNGMEAHLRYDNAHVNSLRGQDVPDLNSSTAVDATGS